MIQNPYIQYAFLPTSEMVYPLQLTVDQLCMTRGYDFSKVSLYVWRLFSSSTERFRNPYV